MTNQLAALLASGVTTGAIYASLALALVMTHRSTGLVNFAQGEMAMFSAYIAWDSDADRAFLLCRVCHHARRVVRHRRDHTVVPDPADVASAAAVADHHLRLACC